MTRRLFSVAILLASVAATALPSPAAAQIGRFPVLAPVGARRGECKTAPTSGELRDQGIMRMTILSLHGSPDRSIAVAVFLDGKIASVTTFLSVPAGEARREGESVMAMFAADGRLKFGQRSYTTTGHPATMAEDRHAELTNADVAAARRLGREVLAICGR